MQVKQIIRSSAVVIAILMAMGNLAYGQLSGFRVAAGLSTMEIIGNNIAEYPFIWVTPKGKLYGGSFDQSQNGFRLEAVFPLDTGSVFEMPVGFDYHFFQGREKEWIEYNSDVKLMHDVDVAALTFGLHYNFYEIHPFEYKAKFYLGMDMRPSLIFNARFKTISNYNFIGDTITNVYDTKSSAFRLGGTLQFGLVGELNKDISIDFRAGLGMMNLLGKSDERGELLTPSKTREDYREAGESSVFDFNFMMLLQFKL
ncbi:hypothetical protein D9V86_04755 [Bacteroidetes/Chlorobi group bacterium ChocPot_Mid]|nr:MAG: hypothetical protein D9V86_04755 [Bacteroidetes/Chlorobi group bacterium ChocPot_Mid]